MHYKRNGEGKKGANQQCFSSSPITGTRPTLMQTLTFFNAIPPPTTLPPTAKTLLPFKFDPRKIYAPLLPFKKAPVALRPIVFNFTAASAPLHCFSRSHPPYSHNNAGHKLMLHSRSRLHSLAPFQALKSSTKNHTSLSILAPPTNGIRL